MAKADRSKNFRKDGTAWVIEYPTYNETSRFLDRMGTMSWRQAVKGCYDLIADLHANARRTDLDLVVWVDAVERKHENLLKAYNETVRISNENQRIHRELIDGLQGQVENLTQQLDTFVTS